MVTENPAEHASVLMKKGIALLNSTSRQGWTESLVYFDEALAIRRALPPSADSWAAYVLAASWMNRGDALTKLGGGDNLREAVRSFDEALAVLATVSIDQNPLYGRRLAIAWINRGLALQEQGVPEALAAARKSFEAGIEVVEARPDLNQVAACGWMNHANVLMRIDPPEPVEAILSAELALALLAIEEESDVAAAETAVHARHVLCQALAQRLIEEESRRGEHAAAALIVVEAGLKAVRSWTERAEARFGAVVSQLFRFGLTLVEQYRPDQLAPYIIEGLPAVGTTCAPHAIAAHEAAVESLAKVWRGLEKEGFAGINTSRLDRWIETLRGLRFADGRLRELKTSAKSAKSTPAVK